MFEATLKNRSSAHFAPVTIKFPIPEDQYEQTILALEKSQIGEARVQDCLIDNVHAPNCPVLNRMTGTMANVDELDWLGKQLCFHYTIDEHITEADFRNLFFRLVFIRNLVGRFNQVCHDLIELRSAF